MNPATNWHAVSRRNPVRAALVAFCAALLSPVMSAPAAEVTLDDLRQDLRQIFSDAGSKLNRPELLNRAEPASPYAIVKKEFLFARPIDFPAPSEPISLRRIRSYPAPLLQAHAACVKIITPWWHGAGVIVSPDGDILTSYHLVANVVTVTVQTIEGRLYPVNGVVACSPVHDLARLRIQGQSFPFIPAAQAAETHAGDPLFIVGHPGNVSWKLSRGTVVRRETDSGTRVVHFESDIGRGNSGGPIVDKDGRLCALTACAAQLADGSSVKVGIDGEAIRQFLAEPVGLPISFERLAAMERIRQVADFMEVLYGLSSVFVDDLHASLAAVTVSAMPAYPGSTNAVAGKRSPVDRVVFANTEACGQDAARLLLLKALVTRCQSMEGLGDGLTSSMADFAAMLDNLIDGVAVLDRCRGKSPAVARTALQQLRDLHDAAEMSFGRALSSLQEVGKHSGFQVADRHRLENMDQLRARYAPSGAGCHVRINEPEG